MGWADRVGHFCTAPAERLWCTGRAFVRRLVFGFGVQLGTDQNDDDREPYPGHEADHRPERAVGLVEIPETRRIPREQRGRSEPRQGGKRASPGNPPPARLRAARAYR